MVRLLQRLLRLENRRIFDRYQNDGQVTFH
jgi:hypothetical protein